MNSTLRLPPRQPSIATISNGVEGPRTRGTTEASVRIAITYFENTSRICDLDSLRKGFAEMLATDLASLPQFVVVERAQLDAVLTELALGNTTFMDKSTVQKLGNGLGATHLLVGSFQVEENLIRVDVRLVDSATAAVVASATEKGARNEIFSIEERLIEAIGRAFNAYVERPVARPASFSAFLSFSSAIAALDKGEMEAAKQLLHSASNAG